MMEELLPCKFYCVATALCVDDRSEVFQLPAPVLAWSLYKEGMHCFDGSQPEQGWIKSTSSLGAFFPFFSAHVPALWSIRITMVAVIIS
ncbi:hypothetical protein M0R45_001708 [Rubus argutus]|uniref:Uncharacterized protein n=1 Tax=Rubus argutus TaxID=59490 RepID=A0AAW1VK73_RUBAR